MIGSTGPTAGQLYIVDTFLVVVFGGAASLLGTIASAFTISQTQSTLEFFLSGSMAKVLTLLDRRRNPDAAAAGPVRPQGPQSKNKKAGHERQLALPQSLRTCRLPAARIVILVRDPAALRSISSGSTWSANI